MHGYWVPSLRQQEHAVSGSALHFIKHLVHQYLY